MAKIHSLSIRNYRGIRNFEEVFSGKPLVCLIGRGDSGKSTILEAIHCVLSPQWNMTFHDSDFTNCDTDQAIEIEVTLMDLPSRLLQEDKFGLYIRGLSIADFTISDQLEDSHESVLTIRLTVKKDLEPSWCVVNGRQEPRTISGNDRSLLNCFLVSDHTDKHFSWNRGNPLYSLLKQEADGAQDDSDEDVVIGALRGAKRIIDKHPFPELAEVVKKVKESAAQIGIDIDNAVNTIDFKDMMMREGRLSLHADKVPFRLKGKGSKRLISIAIQLALVNTGGIILIDEIEQGLEPDRVQHLAAVLKSLAGGQVFLTTHSRDVVVELDAKDLHVVAPSKQSTTALTASVQGLLRKNPEAFFAKKVIVCEGATEVGFCRVLNRHKQSIGQKSAAVCGVRLADGAGDSAFQYSSGLSKAGFYTLLFCDSDLEKTNPIPAKKKEELASGGVQIVDWEVGDCLEVAIAKELPWLGIIELFGSAVRLKAGQKGISEAEAEPRLLEAVRQKYAKEIPSDFKTKEYQDLREPIGKAASAGSWFKSVAGGQILGDIVLKHIATAKASKLFSQLNALSVFIDGNGL
ncbi:AAA family ATPase [Nemorincola caseinilytica]|uniref:AAA family ATPase n=1 Tax=Nemorincola caseinilytica TaxID=2054315 RepID=A0ABP8N7N5_9BACT